MNLNKTSGLNENKYGNTYNSNLIKKIIPSEWGLRFNYKT